MLATEAGRPSSPEVFEALRAQELVPVAVPTTMWSMLAAKTSIGAGLDTQGFESAKVAPGIESVCRKGTRPKLALQRRKLCLMRLPAML